MRPGANTAPHTNDDAGNIVARATVEGCSHQVVGPFLRVAMAANAFAQIVVRDEIRQTIAGEQQTVACLRGERPHFRAFVHLGASEKFVKDVAPGTAFRLVGSDGAAAGKGVGHGMVERQLLDLFAANQVSRAVANPGDPHLIFLLHGQHRRRAHFPLGVLVLTGGDDGLVRFKKGLLNGPAGIDVRDQLIVDDARDDLGGEAAGLLAAFLAAHTVGNEENVAVGVGHAAIFIVGALPLSAAAADVDDEIRHGKMAPAG